MKTKEQILAWLNNQPWKYEFYEAAFLSKMVGKIEYNANFIANAFYWAGTTQGKNVWVSRETEYLKWYHTDNRPRSWEEYCRQTPIPKENYYISSNSKVLSGIKERYRDADSDVSVMPKEHCEAFLAYMKLFQLRNAWVEDENLDDSPVTYRILYQDNMFDVFQGHTSTGLSFIDKEAAKEFMVTFKDLLETAKPLL